MDETEKERPCFGHFDGTKNASFLRSDKTEVLDFNSKQKNHLNLKDSSGLAVELLSRFELETSSLPRMRSTN